MARRAQGDGGQDGNGYWRGARSEGRKYVHISIVENALGRELQGEEQVHHVNEIKADNSPGNLVVCPDMAYHKLLHMRQAALDACGNADYRKCRYCKGWSDPKTMIVEAPRDHHRTPRYRHSGCYSGHSLPQISTGD